MDLWVKQLFHVCSAIQLIGNKYWPTIMSLVLIPTDPEMILGPLWIGCPPLYKLGNLCNQDTLTEF